MLKAILTGVKDGIPMINSIMGLFKKKKQDSINQNNQKPAEEEITLRAKLVGLISEGATVYFVIWLAHKFGITYQDVINIFGLIKN